MHICMRHANALVMTDDLAETTGSALVMTDYLPRLSGPITHAGQRGDTWL
jgi:hypothetical protein